MVFLYSISDLVTIASFIAMIRAVFTEQFRSGKWRFFVCAGVSLACSAAGYLLLTPVTEHAYEILDFIANALAAAAIPFFFRKPRFFRDLAVLFIYYFTIGALWSFLARFFHAEILPELLFHILLGGAVLFFVLRGANHRDVNVIAGAFHQIPVWMVISLLLFELTCYYKEFGVSETWYDALYAVSACLIFLSILYLAFRVFRLVYTQNDILRKLNELLLYETRREQSDEDLRRFRHDFKNHTIVLNALLERGDIDGAKRYFEEIGKDAGGLERRYSTGNTVVNSLLNIKSARAAQSGTEITFAGMIPEEGVAPKDMCVCVGNLIDNAIEACEKTGADHQTIAFTAAAKAGMLILRIVNPTPAEPALKNGALPATTKANRRAHGIGLRNVRDLAKKYNGKLELSAENGLFTAELFLELQS